MLSMCLFQSSSKQQQQNYLEMRTQENELIVMAVLKWELRRSMNGICGLDAELFRKLKVVSMNIYTQTQCNECVAMAKYWKNCDSYRLRMKWFTWQLNVDWKMALNHMFPKGWFEMRKLENEKHANYTESQCKWVVNKWQNNLNVSVWNGIPSDRTQFNPSD